MATTELSSTQTPNYEVKIGKTLMGNWVEERQCSHIDQQPGTIKELHVKGHKGILSTKFESQVNSLSTCKDSYKEPKKSEIRHKGKRLEMLEKQLYDQISSRVQEEANPPPPQVDYHSTTKKDFSKEFTPIVKEATMPHSLQEQPFSFWNQNLNDLHGVSQVKTQDTPFKKNAAFSTPIDEYQDAMKPNEHWEF